MTAPAINVGDLARIRNGPTGVVGSLDGTNVVLEIGPGQIIRCQVADLTRLDADQLAADVAAADETTELPRVENLFAPAQLPPRLDDPATWPQLTLDCTPRRAVTKAELRSLLRLLECVLSLDPTQLADLTPAERLERVERVRGTATTELLRLIQERLSAMGPEPDRTPVAGRHGR